MEIPLFKSRDLGWQEVEKLGLGKAES